MERCRIGSTGHRAVVGVRTGCDRTRIEDRRPARPRLRAHRQDVTFAGMTDTDGQDAAVEALAGGCRCGRLRYQVLGQPQAVNCCHCRDCQRLSGSAFAVNAVYPAPQVELLGTEWSQRDLATDSDGGREWRCAACGVLLFSDHRLFKDALRFVRVGTLDEGERLVPDAHYFVRSKHTWVVIPEGVPAWETLPPARGD